MRSSNNGTKRAYYAEPVDHDDSNGEDIDVTAPSFDELEPQMELEREYDQAQNANFAIRYREEKDLGFLGTHKSIGSGAKVSNVTCRNCAASFTSNNKLHRHLRDPCQAGSLQPDMASPVVVESKAVIPGDPTDGLADFHYAQAFWYITPGTNLYISCIDSGFGNSAIDDELQLRLYPDTYCLPLLHPRLVEGLGGAECTATHVVLLTIYMKGTDGRYTQLVRPFHVFKKLSVPLLIGNDVMKPEKFDLLYSTNRLRIGACDGVCVQIMVYSGSKYGRIPVRCAEGIVIPASSSAVVGVKFGRVLQRNQDYQFTPLHTRSALTGARATHAVVRHDQKGLLYTNFEATPLTIFKGSVLGHVRSLETSASLAWADASNDIKALFGVTRKASLAFTATEVFNPHRTDGLTVSDAPDHDLHDALRSKPRPRPVPTLSTQTIPDGEHSCASESFEILQWLLQEYVPRHEHELPSYMKVPDKATSTWEQVVVNTEDDISSAQIAVLRRLVRRHRSIFNDIMGCVREPEKDWL